MPGLLGVLETVLYVEEFERACPFYEQVLGLNSIYRDQRLCAYDVGGRGSRSKAAPDGRVAAKASIFAIPTVIWSNWQRRGCGRGIRFFRKPARCRRG
jgi:hypothetical protein